MHQTGFTPKVQRLLADSDTSDRDHLYDALQELCLSDLFPDGVHDSNAAQCCHAALWLRHGFLDESHSISQQVPTAEGSFWHGIMHRMEQDYWNSKYWFDRVGSHPVFPVIAERVAELDSEASAILGHGNSWRPDAFVDFCEQADELGGPQGQLRDTITRIEWEALFEYCWDAAHG